MPTVKVHAPELSGQTGLLLWLYKDSDGTLLNAGGDLLTESGSTGLFSATVAETISAIHRADVTNAAGTLLFRSGWIAAAGTVVRDEYPTTTGTDYLMLQSTTIATLTSQTVFTLTAGSPDNDSYNGCILIVEDQATAEQKAKCIINDYVGASKTVTIRTAPAFTIATGDAVRIFAIGEGDMLDAPRVVSLSSATWTADTIVGFPSSLNIGDSYVDEVNRAITIYYRDADENPVTAVGSKNLTDADFISELVISQGNRSGRIKILTGWTVASEGYLLIEIPQSETRRLAEGDATLQLTFKWDGGFEVVVATQTIQMLKKH